MSRVDLACSYVIGLPAVPRREKPVEAPARPRLGLGTKPRPRVGLGVKTSKVGSVTR